MLYSLFVMRIGSYCAVAVMFPAGVTGGYKDFGSFLTYRGDKSTSKYQSHKKFPE
jgi:hypothetical protein